MLDWDTKVVEKVKVNIDLKKHEVEGNKLNQHKLMLLDGDLYSLASAKMSRDIGSGLKSEVFFAERPDTEYSQEEAESPIKKALRTFVKTKMKEYQ